MSANSTPAAASSQPVRSMTGYARARRTGPSGEATVSVKSLNHRGLDIHVHTSLDLTIENEIRAAVKRRVNRGHIEVRIAMTFGGAGSANGLNTTLLDAYIAAYAEASHRTGNTAPFDVNSALRAPGMLAPLAERSVTAEDEQAILGALEEALELVTQFREREGAQLVHVIARHNAKVTEAATGIEQLRAKAVDHCFARLQERLSELLANTALDPQRLTQEAALLADRSDVSEEIARLKIHAGQLDKLLAAGGDVGKRLDFLLQEMNRETNTILSKTSGVGEVGVVITDLAIGAKAEIEKIREQSLNLE